MNGGFIQCLKIWNYTATGRKLSKELQKLIPEKVFDAHAHLYGVKDLDVPREHLFKQNPAEVAVAVWCRKMEKQVGPRAGLPI